MIAHIANNAMYAPPAKAGTHLGSSRQVTKKKRSDNTQRRKRDRKADYTPDFAPSSRRVSTAETLRYRLPECLVNFLMARTIRLRSFGCQDEIISTWAMVMR